MIHPVNSVVKKRASQAPGPREEAKAVFRRAILNAAADVFVEQGFHAARIQDIAERARIGVGTVYNHFEQKEDVLHALLEEHTSAMVERFASHPSDPADFAGALEQRISRVLAYKDEHRAFFALAMDYGLMGPTTGAAAMVLKGRKVHKDGMKKAGVAFFTEAQRKGDLRSDFDAEHLLRILGGILRAFADDTIAEGATFASRAAQIADVFLSGASPRKKRKA
jgi:AcrR family transcriptional regulator